MRRSTSAWLTLAAAVLGGCKDALRPDGTGSIVIRVEVGTETASGLAGSAGDVATHLQSARATATSGSTTLTAQLSGGASGFNGTIANVPAGTYTVTVEGLVGTEVDYFGLQAGLSVQSGQTATANVTFSSFIPTLSAVTTPTASFRPSLSFSSVSNATSYLIEVARNSGFTGSTSTAVTTTSATVSVSDTGTHYVRVRAVNATVTQGGRASSTQTFRVVTDQRPSGDAFATAANLGFFSSATVTLDSLNIYPPTDVDWFQLSDCNGDSLTITAQAVRLSPPSPLNSALALFSGATGRLIGLNDNADSTDARIRMQLDADGNYRVAVSGSGNTTGHYKLVVQPKAGANNAGTSCRVQPLAVTSLSSGRDHTCAVRANGTVDCWGRNGFGELGNGTSGNATSSPVRVSTSQTFSTVTAGGVHTCALTSTGAAYCWGRNFNSQLGNGTTADAQTPVPVSGGRTFQKLSAGTFHTCALDSGGAAYCWGSNFNGKLGDGTINSSATPVPVSTAQFFQAIGAGDQHTCGLTTTGSVYCWGDNDFGQLGNGTNTGNPTPVFVGSGYAALAVGGFHTCARTTGGGVNCWGMGIFGQLGNGSFTSSNIPVAVAGALIFSSISTGRYTTCGMVGSSAYCWGDNFDGEVGDNSTTHRSQPVVVSTAVTFQSVSVGGFHSCAVRTTTGDAYCWGWNNFGQVGDGSAFEHTGPVAVTAIPVSKVSAGGEHTCALRADGGAACWGWNLDGQLGDGTFTDRASPGFVSGLTSGVTGIAAGASHSCALNTSGVASCWGDNFDGQLGNGTAVSSATPVTVTGSPSPFTAITAGDFHTCGLGQNGTVYCWGDNSDGQIGNGTTIDALSAVAISSGLTFKQVSAGGGLTCALSTTNIAYCWGDNGSGGVGNGTTSATPVTTPTQVQAPVGVTFASLSAGLDFSCGVTTAGVGYCWGNNDDGQLGNNSTTSSSTPVQVSGGLTWKTITASRSAGACGITTSDLLYCWGDNFTGQLGNGTFNDVSTPTWVVAATTFQWVQTGDVHTCGVSTGGTVYCWGNDERGELGRGTATTIRKIPVAVVTGPASVPVLAASLETTFPGEGESVERPGSTGAGSEPAAKRRPRPPRR